MPLDRVKADDLKTSLIIIIIIVIGNLPTIQTNWLLIDYIHY